MLEKEYLGDSVYIQPGGYTPGTLVMTTENGHPSDPSNKIVLEPEVLETLKRYLKRHEEALAAGKPGEHPAHQMADGKPDPLGPANWKDNKQS